ncbi:hypothetical protein TNCV_1855831 [Trichonephila clavipes]|nr:hypothetical protein TNCV_1855831 [Trichonephila clavipes]
MMSPSHGKQRPVRSSGWFANFTRHATAIWNIVKWLTADEAQTGDAYSSIGRRKDLWSRSLSLIRSLLFREIKLLSVWLIPAAF